MEKSSRVEEGYGRARTRRKEDRQGEESCHRMASTEQALMRSKAARGRALNITCVLQMVKTG